MPRKEAFYPVEIFSIILFIVNIIMENTTQQPESITIVDLDLLRNIVDLACTRGAFRGAEVKQVGEVYDKLTNFLSAVIEQAKAQEAATSPADATTSETPQGE